MSSSTKKPVILAVLEYGEFPELIRVAHVLRSSLDRPILFFFVKRGYRRLGEDSTVVVDNGFSWIDSEGRLHREAAETRVVETILSPSAQEKSEPIPPSTVRNRSRKGKVLTLLRLAPYAMAFFALAIYGTLRLYARDLANFHRDVRRFSGRYHEMERVLSRFAPALVVVGQEPPGSELPFLLAAAGRLGIPRLVTPFAMFSLRVTAEYASSRPEYRVDFSPLNAAVAKTFPHWVMTWKGRRLLRLPGWRALALEWTGLTLGLPWSPLSEPVESITAPSDVAATAMAEMGVDRARVTVVGSPVHDRLAAYLAERHALRARICCELDLDPSRPILLCGWPANIFAWLSGRAIAYPNYEALANAWVKALVDVKAKYGINVIASIHPKTLASEYRVATEHGIACVDGRTDELIAACDIFTTLNGSSVTAWAIACGIPVVLFDCFETHYTDFNNVPGCVLAETEEQFVSSLDALCGNAEFREKQASEQRIVAEGWGRLDGNAGKRLSDLAAKLVGSAE
ncbi:hypothetical protein FVA81_03355 (plasmid) [Rhizobium sp. WL3]|uniref:hypothetical protein n=1 Tax=Rhizobium sp. WL3 TaxID=2603277 RepID=UPI0011C1E9C3|nr:hypothetical protein [Rhizobium sp. WL3]QEE43673.1 hypothetical protein FVA81_03355 [Rhizobium sp. WL3]